MDLAGGLLDPPRVRGESRVRGGGDLAAKLEEWTGLKVNARVPREKGLDIIGKERFNV